MKIKRYKKIQRNIGFFQKHFGFRIPYQILVDGTFANAALQNKVHIREQLAKYLNGGVKILTTPCVLMETEEVGTVLTGALQILRKFPIHKCSHASGKAVPALKCLKSMVVPNNSSRYVVATQDMKLREQLRNVPGVALLYLHGNAPTLETPSDRSQEVAQIKSEHKTDLLSHQKEILDHLKKQSQVEDPQPTGHKGTKKRKRAGPNPLSCKKSKKKRLQPQQNSKDTNRKRKRPKVRVANHVKEELQHRPTPAKT